MNKPVLLNTFPNEIETQIACGRLKAEGIEFVTKLNARAGAFVGMGDAGKITDVIIDEKDLERAKIALQME